MTICPNGVIEDELPICNTGKYLVTGMSFLLAFCVFLFFEIQSNSKLIEINAKNTISSSHKLELQLTNIHGTLKGMSKQFDMEKETQKIIKEMEARHEKQLKDLKNKINR